VPLMVAKWALAALAAAALAGCTSGPLAGPAPAPLPASAPEAAAPAPAAEETAAEEQRDRYIMHALADGPPAPLKGRREIALGTGFFIAPDLVMTNFHVAGNCAALTVGNGIEGRELLAKLVAGSRADDLAVIQTDAAAGRPARFETALYTESGQDLAVVGYPEHGLAVLEAELSPVSAREQDLLTPRPRYFFHGAIRLGNSGSPVLDDTGAVVGVVSAKIDTVAVYRRTGRVVDDIGFAIANRTVFDFLKRSDIPYLPALPARGLTAPELLTKANSFVRQIGCWQ